jgi:hypothetical protein
MAKVFIICVAPHERQLKSGETYEEAEVRAAGYRPEDLVARGEAVMVSSPAAPAKKEVPVEKPTKKKRK